MRKGKPVRQSERKQVKACRLCEAVREQAQELCKGKPQGLCTQLRNTIRSDCKEAVKGGTVNETSSGWRFPENCEELTGNLRNYEKPWGECPEKPRVNPARD